MTQPYADQCLERAEKAPDAPNVYRLDGPKEWRNECTSFYFHARTDVFELATRLKKACSRLRELSAKRRDDEFIDELEAPLEEECEPPL